MADASIKFLVRSFPAPGFDGVFGGGRKWPTDGTVVQFIDGDDDVEPTNGEPLKVGKRTRAALEGKPGRFSISLDEPLEHINGLKARVAELEAENAALKEQLADKAKSKK